MPVRARERKNVHEQVIKKLYGARIGSDSDKPATIKPSLVSGSGCCHICVSIFLSIIAKP